MFHKRNPPVGARPGTLAIPEGSPAPRLYSFSYDEQALEEGPVTDLSTMCNDERVNWIDVQGMGDEATLWRVAEAFGIHPLALEDAINSPQRAKVEVFAKHLLIIARTPVRDEHGALSLPQVAIFVGDGYVVTFQEHRLGLFDPVRERIRAGVGPIRTMESDYLAYALIDALMDRYYPVVEELSDELTELEIEVMDDAAAQILPEIHRARRELVLLRRVGWPQRAAVQDLLREDLPFVAPETRPYLRDTLDHIAQVVELVDASRDVARAVMDMYLSNVSNRTNDIMKVLTLMASIFIPLTFMAGIYGMNFDNMPELHSAWGYPFLLGAMLIVGAGMLYFFYRRGWIGQGPPRRPRPLTAGKVERKPEIRPG